VPSRLLGHKTAEVAQLTEAGLLEIFQDNLRLTLKGKLLADTVAQYLL
jgi:coproporphyrinogen III oxidase-like Fe-S oxidoreductase